MLALLILAMLFIARSPAGAADRTIYQEIEIPWPTPEEKEILRSLPDLELLRFERGESMRLLSTEEMTAALVGGGLRPAVLVGDYAQHHGLLALRAEPGLRGFFSYGETVAFLDSIHAEHPAITTEKDSIGASIEGRTIWAIKVSDNPDVDEAEPEILLDGLHHAREPITVSVLLGYIAHLCDNYGSDPEATYIVDEREIWFVPILNPDGYIYNETLSPDMMWRKNRRDNPGDCEGVDMNRNYDFHWGEEGSSGNMCDQTYRGTGPFSEPETRVLRDFIFAHDFVIHDSYHSVIGTILYPWGYTTSAAPDAALFASICNERVSESGYDYYQGSGLYPVSGGCFDWSYGVAGLIAFTTEVGGSSFWPTDAEIPGLVAENIYSNIFLSLAAGSCVRLASVSVTGGNGDTQLEPGETAGLLVTVENPGLTADAADVTALLRSNDPYIQIHDASTFYGTIPSRGNADNGGDLFAVTLDAATPKGHRVEFRLTTEWNGGFPYEETIVLNTGTPLYSDDFESGNNGWTVDPTHTASTGEWVIIDPNPTNYQPGDDTTPDPGVHAWITGQNSADGVGDVDLGVSAIRSPTWDLSSYESVILAFNYFFGQRDDGDDEWGDFFKVDLSNDGGVSWNSHPIAIGDWFHEPSWIPFQVNLENELPLTDQMVIRLQASDEPLPGDIIEAGLDDLVLLEGGSENEPPGAPAPESPLGGETVGSAPELVVANASDPELDPLTYSFAVYDDSLLTNPVRTVTGVAEGVAQTGWTVDPVLADGEYWWRTYAEDAEKRGLFSASSPFGVDAVATGAGSAASAARFALFPARPNPSPGGTTVRFLLPKSGRVRADLFDVNGRRVRSLFRGVLSGGAHSITWDGRDQRGNESAAGVYFVRLRQGNEEKSIKLILVR